MTIDHRLIAMLVCPICKGPLEAGRDADGRLVELECTADKIVKSVVGSRLQNVGW